MSNKSNLLISILVLLLGVVFCWLCESPTLSERILFWGGLAFLVPGAISLASLFFTHKGQQINGFQKVIQLVCGVGGLVLGLCVLFMHDFFRSLLGFMFGALLIAGGAWQIFLLTRKGRRSDYAAWTVAAPVLCLVGGVLMISMPWFRNELNEKYLVLCRPACPARGQGRRIGRATSRGNGRGISCRPGGRYHKPPSGRRPPAGRQHPLRASTC